MGIALRPSGTGAAPSVASDADRYPEGRKVRLQREKAVNGMTKWKGIAGRLVVAAGGLTALVAVLSAFGKWN
jgi:hypothetical protein